MAETVPVHEGLFTTATDGTARLVAGRCRACGHHHFPRGGTCPYCSSEDVDEALLSGEGSLWTWTAVTAPPPGYQGEVPFGFGVVELAEGHRVLDALGMTGGPIVDIEAGCASGGAAVMLATGAIAAGQYDSVLVFGMEKMPKGIIRSSFFAPWQEEAGMAATPAYFALRAQRLMRESGVTRDHLADVVVKNRAHGVHNPDAMFRKPVTAEEVLASRLVCEPLHLWMLCSPNERTAAVVLRLARPGASG